MLCDIFGIMPQTEHLPKRNSCRELLYKLDATFFVGDILQEVLRKKYIFPDIPWHVLKGRFMEIFFLELLLEEVKLYPN